MNRQIKSVTAVSVLGALLGCAPMSSQHSALQPRVQPSAPRLTVGGVTVPVTMAPAPAPATSLDALYLQGRAAHGTGRLEEAARQYERVLQRAPDHVAALNALGVTRAQLGELAQALILFERALARAPEAAHIHNNAGYALLQAGRLDEAQNHLQRAQAINPSSVQTQQNLQLLALAQEKARPASPPPEPAVRPAAEPAETRLVAIDPHRYELRTAGAAPASSGAQGLTLPPAREEAPSLRGVRVEVANGVGITRLGRYTAERLQRSGAVPARLTNAKPYRQQNTEIQYAAGQETAALALQMRLPLTPPLVASTRLAPGVQLRLVLGRDLAPQTYVAWLKEGRTTTIAQRQRGGWLWG